MSVAPTATVGGMHLVQFSTGAGSAEVALRVYAEHGAATVLLTADTGVEDEDNWRYAREIVALMPDATWTILKDGRTPMQVGRDARCVPNNRMAVCSRVLKRELIRAHLDANYDPAIDIVYLGYDWTEDNRMEAATKPWLPWQVRCPLMDPPYLTKSQILDMHRDRYGIEPCRLYTAGFSHANCGGGCVRAGQSDWRRLLFWNPDRYAEWEAEEEPTRDLLGKDVAILRHRSGPDEGTALSLRSYREQLTTNSLDFDTEDPSACGCDPWVTA
jgi:hypothetical protein